MKKSKTSFNDVLKTKAPKLYDELTEWMKKYCYEYNIVWKHLSMTDFFRDHSYDPEMNIKSIRMLHRSKVIIEASDLGMKLLKKLDFIISKCKDEQKTKNYFAYITQLVYRYHIESMMTFMWYNDDAQYYITGIRDQEWRCCKFDSYAPGKNDIYDDVAPVLRIGANSDVEIEEVRIFDILSGIMLNKYTDEDLLKLIGEPNLLNNVYRAYTSFMHKYALGVAYDIENDPAFRYHTISITDNHIFESLPRAAEFCIQVFLLSLKARYFDCLWNTIIHPIQDDVMISLPTIDDIKVINCTSDGSVTFKDMSLERPRKNLDTEDEDSEPVIDDEFAKGILAENAVREFDAKGLLMMFDNTEYRPQIMEFIDKNIDENGNVTVNIKWLMSILCKTDEDSKSDN